jgi:hypothetical protein
MKDEPIKIEVESGREVTWQEHATIDCHPDVHICVVGLAGCPPPQQDGVPISTDQPRGLWARLVAKVLARSI